MPDVRLSEHPRIVCYTPRGDRRPIRAMLVADRGRGVHDLTYYVGDVQMSAYAICPGPPGKPGTFCEQDPPAAGCALPPAPARVRAGWPHAGDDLGPGETTADAAHAAVDIGD